MVKEYSAEFRDDRLAAEYAKIRMMEQLVNTLDEQNDHLETIARNTRENGDHYTQ